MTDDQFWDVLDQVVRLEVLKGHQRWTISELSRVSKVSRPLIYYYFGKSKPEIVKAALKVIGDEFFGLSAERMRMSAEGLVKESILKTRALIRKAPHIVEFFFHWRHQNSEVSDHLKSLEKRYLQKLKKARPDFKPGEAEALYSIFFGLAVVPDLKEDVLELILSRAL